MKIAIINVYCQHGSTGKAVLRQYKQLKKLGHEVRIYYGSNKQEIDDQDIEYFGNRYVNYIHMLISKYLGLTGLLSNSTTGLLLRRLKKYQPDIVWLKGLHGYYLNEFRLLKFLKKSDIMTIYGMPDEYAFCGKCCSAYNCEKYKSGCRNCPHLRDYPSSLVFDNSTLIFNLKKKAYSGFDKIVFRSAPYVISKARESILLKDKELVESDSSVDVSGIFYPRNTADIRKELGIDKEKKVVLLCAPYADVLKGGKYYMEAARRCKGDNIVFLNVNYAYDESICPSNFIALPYERNQNKLAEYYSLADAYVCTSISDAQPNTCLEALGCGTPIVGFNTSGVPFIAPNEFGTFVEPFDVGKLVDAIRATPRKTPESIQACHKYAMSRFSLEASERRFREFIADICRRVEQDKIKN